MLPSFNIPIRSLFGYLAAAGGGVTDMNLDIQTFTSDGTWTKPANALSCEILIVDGGAGGSGGGYDTDHGTPGSGGTAGITAHWQVPAVWMPSSVAVTIGLGTAGGAGAIDNNVGVPAAGGASSFGSLISTHQASTTYNPFGIYGGNTGNVNAGNGGNGGDIDGAGVNGSGTYAFYFDGNDSTYYQTQGTGGAASANGTNGSAEVPIGGGGGGGGGGAVTATSAGGNGGAGGAYGGGGGGGGSGDGTFTGGDGGAGGDGVVIVYTITK